MMSRDAVRKVWGAVREKQAAGNGWSVLQWLHPGFFRGDRSPLGRAVKTALANRLSVDPVAWNAVKLLQHAEEGADREMVLQKVADMLGLKGFRQAGGFAIGPNGLEPTAVIELKPNTIHYMGASSSPHLVIVTDVKDDYITYLDSNVNYQKRREAAWIAQDLIARGDATWMKSRGKYPELKDERPGTKVNPQKWVKDQERGYVAVEAIKPENDYPRGDPWYAAEEYGGVGGVEEDGKQLYEINTSRGQLDKLLKDKRFKVVKKFSPSRHFGRA